MMCSCYCIQNNICVAKHYTVRESMCVCAGKRRKGQSTGEREEEITQKDQREKKDRGGKRDAAQQA